MQRRELAQILRENPDVVVVSDEDFAISPPASGLSEHELQRAVFDEIKGRALLRVEYNLIYAIGNGGYRHKATAAKLKAEGVKPGVWDIYVSVARHGYHGLYLETKVGRNKLTEAQEQWSAWASAEGYLCKVYYTFDEAMAILTWYLEG